MRVLTVDGLSANLNIVIYRSDVQQCATILVPYRLKVAVMVNSTSSFDGDGEEEKEEKSAFELLELVSLFTRESSAIPGRQYVL